MSTLASYRDVDDSDSDSDSDGDSVLPFPLEGGKFHSETVVALPDFSGVDDDRCPHPACGYDRAIVVEHNHMNGHRVRCANPECGTVIDEG